MFLLPPLQNLGLSEKEAKIYLAALEIGGGSAQEIATKAAVKRPTTYVILEQLKEKGLIFEEKIGLGSKFLAAKPEVLKQKAQDQLRRIDESLPFLTAMYKGEPSQPQVFVYEGIEAMRRLYLETVWKSKTEILFFASIRKIQEAIPDLLDSWVSHLGDSKNPFQSKTREFVNPDPADITYGLTATKKNPGSQVRIIPPEAHIQFIGTDNAIFEDKIMMVSFEEKLFITIIQSAVLADTLRTLFELAWSSAIPVAEFVHMHPEYTKS